MQIKAGFKKEFQFFSRTFRMWGVIIAIVAFAIVDPLMMKAMSGLGDTMNSMITGVAAGDTVDEAAVDEAVAAVDEFSSMFGQIDAAYCVSGTLGDFSSTALLIILLVLMGTAGAEQKKRSVIIPLRSGLKPVNYILPKFVFYPLFVLVLATVGTVLAGIVSNMLFADFTPVNLANCAVAGIMIGCYLAFLVSAHLMVGISTGKAGISVIAVFIMSSFLPLILQIYGADKFNPFALAGIAGNAINGEFDATNIAFSLVTTLILILIFFFITLFVQTAQKIDNAENDNPLGTL